MKDFPTDTAFAGGRRQVRPSLRSFRRVGASRSSKVVSRSGCETGRCGLTIGSRDLPKIALTEIINPV